MGMRLLPHSLEDEQGTPYHNPGDIGHNTSNMILPYGESHDIVDMMGDVADDMVLLVVNTAKFLS